MADEVTVQEAKTHLSRLLRKVEAGETVIIRGGAHRVALLSPVPPVKGERRIWGNLKGKTSVDFDEPLADFGEHQRPRPLPAPASC